MKMVGSLPGFFIGVGDQEADLAMLFIIFVAFLAIFNNSTLSELPFVWGAAAFVSITGTIMSAAAGSGIAFLLVPIAFVFCSKVWFPGITDFFGPGLMAFVTVAFFAVAAGV
ncbi:MAG: hypothetical protein V1881_00940 [Candidatus Micrarchaeota archaeon]